MQKEEEARSTKKGEGVKKHCGCDVVITIKWDTYKKAEDMRRISYAVGSLVDTAKHQCLGKDKKPDAANSKAFCDNIKEYEIGYSEDDKDVKYDKEKKKIRAFSNDMSYTGDLQLIEFVEKF